MLAIGGLAPAEEPSFREVAIFPPEPKHNHASCVVELPGGDLLAAWYSGSGERRADDVVIQAARLAKGAEAWGPRFLLADTPGYPDCNPALFAAPDGTLWLWRPVILDHRWEGALLKYSVTDRAPDADSPPRWIDQGVVHVTPVGFAEAVDAALKGLGGEVLKTFSAALTEIDERAGDLLYQRLGWMPRVHPTVLPSGRWVLPLYTDTFSCSLMMLSDDRGRTWRTGAAMIGFGNIQPSVVRREDGTLVAFMRDNGPWGRIAVSTSADEGETWSEVTRSDLPNPGAGVEAIRLASGRWALVHNDTARGRHSLALSLSEDEGRTWPITRHIARTGPGPEQFHYPSIVQAADGRIHVTYTHGGTPEGSTIRHARFNEAWVLQGDPR